MTGEVESEPELTPLVTEFGFLLSRGSCPSLLIEPLLPPWRERLPGPRPVPDLLCLQGVLYVLHHDIPWQLVPQELEFDSRMACWRGLERWQQAGVFGQSAGNADLNSTTPWCRWPAGSSAEGD
jgi:hypothetical protein